MARKISLPTMQEIEALSDSGDIAKLREINERLAKTANQRMKQLRQSGYGTTAALKRAEDYVWQEADFTTGGVFSRSKKLTEEQLTEQIEHELIFLRSKTSTVRGEKARREKIFASLTEERSTLNEYGEVVKIGPVIDLSKLDVDLPSEYKDDYSYFKDKFLEFLDDDVWKDVKKYLYAGNTDILQEAGEAMARGADINDLTNMYKNFLRGEVSMYEIWDQWTSVK